MKIVSPSIEQNRFVGFSKSLQRRLQQSRIGTRSGNHDETIARDHRFAVIGAGFAGLSATYHLLVS